MEQLEQSQSESIKKMSTDRLRTKLAEIGFDTKQLTEMTHDQLLDTWAKVLFSMKDIPPMAVATEVLTVGYDVELEKMRLEFEMKKFETEEAHRREEMEAAKLREEREEARRREDMEREETRRREEREATRLREEKRKHVGDRRENYRGARIAYP